MFESSTLVEQIRALQNQHPAFAVSTLLAYDETRALNEAGEKQMHELGVAEALISRSEGGQFQAMPELLEVLKAVCAKDLSFGLGYVLTTFMALTNLWVAGSTSQRQRAAQLLRDNYRIAVAYHELEHGNDFAANTLSARKVAGGYLLNGRKQLINNALRCGAAVVQARTADETGLRSHSLFWLDREQVQTGWQTLDRIRTVGVHSCQLAGLELIDCFVPDSALLGEPGEAIAIALKAFQLTRAVLPALAMGQVERVLGQTLDYALQRRLYGRPMADIPHTRAVLVECAADYWLAQALSHTTVAALHCWPQHMSAYAALTKYWVPKQVATIFKALSQLLGARYYSREGEAALFEKTLRDYPVLTVGHASSWTCEATLRPFLPILLRHLGRSEPLDEAQAKAVFASEEKPDFALHHLRLSPPSGDPWLNLGLDWPLRLETSQLTGLDDRPARLARHILALKTQPDPARYAWVQAANAVIGRWIYASEAERVAHEVMTKLALDRALAQLDGSQQVVDVDRMDAAVHWMQNQACFRLFSY